MISFVLFHLSQLIKLTFLHDRELSPHPVQQACQTKFGSGAGSRLSVLRWAGSVKECQLQIFNLFKKIITFDLMPGRIKSSNGPGPARGPYV